MLYFYVLDQNPKSNEGGREGGKTFKKKNMGEK